MNPFLEAERARKRESLLAATEADLEKIAAACRLPPAACARARRPLRGQDRIAPRIGKVLNRRKIASHLTIDIGDDHFSYVRNQDSITAEAALDGKRTAHQHRVRRPGQRRGCLLLQGPGPRRAGSPRLQHRPGHPALSSTARRPGPRPRVPAHVLLLHHLAHAPAPRALAVHPRRQASRQAARPPGPAPSLPPPALCGHWPRPPPSTPMTTPRCTALPPCWPSWPPSA